MVGQLSSLVGDEVGTRVYVLLDRVQMRRICAVFFSGSLPPVYVLPDRVQLWRICSLFFLFFPRRTLVGDGSPGWRREDRVQLWRICAVFFSGPLPPV